MKPTIIPIRFEVPYPKVDFSTVLAESLIKLFDNSSFGSNRGVVLPALALHVWYTPQFSIEEIKNELTQIGFHNRKTTVGQSSFPYIDQDNNLCYMGYAGEGYLFFYSDIKK